MIKYDGVDSIIKSANQQQEKPKGELFGEVESRKRLLGLARKMGCLEDVISIFDRYDLMLRNCTNITERKHMSILGIAEVNKAMGLSGSYTAGGLLIGESDQE